MKGQAETTELLSIVGMTIVLIVIIPIIIPTIQKTLESFTSDSTSVISKDLASSLTNAILISLNAFSTIFVPIITRSIVYLSSSLPMNTKNVTVGDKIILSRNVGNLSAKYHVEKPTGENIFILPEVKQEKVKLILPIAEMPGIYRFYSGKALIGIRAANIDPGESDFRFITKREIEKNFSKNHVKVVEENESLESVVSRARWGRELWREALLLSLIVLVLEMVIAKEWRNYEKDRKK